MDAVGGDALRGAAALVRRPRQIRSSAAPALATELGGSGITRRRDAAVYAELADLVARGGIRPVIHATFPFEEAAAAVAQVATGHATGKTVVTAEGGVGA
ncbi:zinc-binding dehydrogenase [Arsenicicoccus sp. oral taxon 190]|uniref:zinc-binding dehydrogenase n=1 Tax=Arsenicicoccus sp. oral taxon 190 TaxID=1658671 RepID=UPI000A4BAF56|nr:zinc-binding dehydrogenase [Arsenicicoccus sp. oral taxon 190]